MRDKSLQRVGSSDPSCDLGGDLASDLTGFLGFSREIGVTERPRGVGT